MKRKLQELCLFTAREVVSCTVLTPTAKCISSVVALLTLSLSLSLCYLYLLFSSELYTGFPFSLVLLSSVRFLFHSVCSNFVPIISPLCLLFCYVYFPYLTCFWLLFRYERYFLSNSTVGLIVSDGIFGFASFQTYTTFRRC